MAASYGKDAVAEALVAAGADPTAANDVRNAVTTAVPD